MAFTRPLSFRHIEVIRCVIQAGSATAAAKLLHVTQPAVSNVVKDAEDRLGFPLFERRGTRLEPTAEAMALFDEIERSFFGLNLINSAADRLRQSRLRRLSVVAAPSLAALLIPRAIAKWHARMPDTVFSLEPCEAAMASSRVTSGKADIGFGVLVPPLPGLKIDHLLDCPLACLLRPDHPLAQRGTPISASDLSDLPMVCQPMGHPTRIMVDEFLAAAPRPPMMVVEASAALCQWALVAEGVGFAITWPGPTPPHPDSRVHIAELNPRMEFAVFAYTLSGRIPRNELDFLLQTVREVA